LGSGILIKFTIPGELTDLNTYVDAERANKYAAANIKKINTDLVTYLTKKLTPINIPVEVVITWVTKNEMKDPDNVAFAKKFILDGLVKSGVLKNDGRKQIKGFRDKYDTDKDNPRVEVELHEN
jgi:Holliday junction resolvase RusA-like endonuclease